MPVTVPGIDLAGLTRWLDTQFGADIPEVRVISGGKSNLTYEIVHSGQSMVLRRPPLGHVLATAHDMKREYTVLSALHPTGVPVPRTLGYCADESVIGAPFYLMAKVEGTVYRSTGQLVDIAPDAARTLADALADTLARLHAIEPAAVGLAGFGRPEGFLDRQVARWRKQLAASHSRDLPGAEELAQRLAGAVPRGTRAGILHGDYRLDNVIVRDCRLDKVIGRDGVIAAVLDWEMSTLGDPLTDLGVACVYWDGVAGFGDAVPPSPGSLPGWPRRSYLVERYARAGGAPPDRLDWYLAFAYFKLAVILEGIWYRHTQGLTVGEGFAGIGAGVPELIARGLVAAAEDTTTGER